MDMTEQLQVVSLAREFAEGEVRPNVESWEHAGALPSEFVGSLAETGFLGTTLPEEHEALGLDFGVYTDIVRALAWGDASAGLLVAVHETAARHVLGHGSDEVRSTWIPRFTGECVLSYALHEAGVGADTTRLQTQVTAEAVTGNKDWVTAGRSADRVLVFGRDGDRQTSALVSPQGDGYSTTPVATTMGLKASEAVKLSLEGAPVADGEFVGATEGPHDEPSRYFMQVGLAAVANGISQAALEHATRYSQERQQFGTALAGFGAIQAKLGEMGARLKASDALMRSAARVLQDAGTYRGGTDSAAATCASAKTIAAETALYVTDEAVQIFGGYGYMRDYPVEKLMRDAYGIAVLGGNSDAMRATVAAEILSNDNN